MDQVRQLPSSAFKNTNDTSSEVYRTIEDSLKSAVQVHINNRLREEYYFEQIESSQLLDLSDSCVNYYVKKFPERHFTVQGNSKEYVLRPAACAGALKKWQTIPPHLLSTHTPAVIHENAICHRLEKTGELKPLERSLSFRMPDYHILVKTELAPTVYNTLDRVLLQFYSALDLDATSFSKVARFNTNNPEQYERLLTGEVQKDYDFQSRPENQKPYYDFKVEYAYKGLQVGTIQVDRYYPRAFSLGDQYSVLHFSPGSYTRLIDVLNKAGRLPVQGFKLVILGRAKNNPLELLRAAVSCGILVDSRPLKEALRFHSVLDVLYPYVVIKGDMQASDLYSFINRNTGEKKQVTIDQLKAITEPLLNRKCQTQYYARAFYKYKDCSVF